MMSEVWAKWENRVINGVLPLRRFLGRSNHSVVFLTEYKAHNLADAAIKLVPADEATADTQLAYWKSAAALAHPNLIRLFDTGQCQLGGHPFLYVVMEYAEETLAQILPKRALTPDEVRYLLRPTLETLTFLHDKDLVHGQIKPPNLLVIGDQLKLSSDNIHPVGTARPSIAKRSVYDPPEAKIGGIDAKGDVWGLGVTLVEALTQRLPAGLDQRTEIVVLPPAPIPAGFEQVTERCLRRDPALRPTIEDLQNQFDPAPPPEVVERPAETEAAASAASAPATSEAPSPAPTPAPQATAPTVPSPEESGLTLPELLVQAPSLGPLRKPSAGRLPLWGTVAALVVAGSGWGIWHSRNAGFPSAKQPPTPVASPAASAVPPAAPPNPAPAPAAATSAPTPVAAADAARAVRHEEIPRISRGARASIRGDIVVTVRVTVDRAGTVVDSAVENRANSKYFTRVASEAARKWRFAAAERPDSREWLLEFDFTRGGISGHAIPRS
jgi:TonB family protein